MKLSITFRHFDASDSLKQYAKEKAERIERHLDPDIEVHVVLSLIRHLHHADVTVYAGPFVMRGSEESDDMYASIDLAMEKIQRQLKRIKEKLRHHHGKKQVHHGEALLKSPTRAKAAKSPKTPVRKAAEADSPRVIRSPAQLGKPLSLDEATRQLDNNGRDFLIFTNAKTRSVNVMYRRPDGHFGLVEVPSPSGATAAAVN
ncbi:MAG: ribosome hibernation-promoting factor, HPF/YfiA family [Myxococcaceae bacterium]